MSHQPQSQAAALDSLCSRGKMLTEGMSRGHRMQHCSMAWPLRPLSLNKNERETHSCCHGTNGAGSPTCCIHWVLSGLRLEVWHVVPYSYPIRAAGWLGFTLISAPLLGHPATLDGNWKVCRDLLYLVPTKSLLDFISLSAVQAALLAAARLCWHCPACAVCSFPRFGTIAGTVPRGYKHELMLVSSTRVSIQYWISDE